MRAPLPATVLFATLMTLVTTVHGFNATSESRLYTDLLVNYNVAVRPSNETSVEVEYQLTALLELNAQTQTLSVGGRWLLRWNDSRLAWDQSQYSDISTIQLKDDKIWTPYLVLENSVNDLSAVEKGKMPLSVDSGGLVTWSPPGVHTVVCDMDTYFFPYDLQDCSLRVTSLGINIVNGKLRLSNYFVDQGEWTVHWIWQTTHRTEAVAKYDADYGYDEVQFNFKFGRNGEHYAFTILFPVVWTALLVGCVFLIPVESGEKIGYCLTLLLAYMVTLSIIAGDLPTKGSGLSVLDWYMATVLLSSGSSVVFSVIVMKIYHRPDDIPIRKWMLEVTNFGLRILDILDCRKYRINPKAVAVSSAKDGNGGQETEKKNLLTEQQLTRNYSKLKLRPITPKSSLQDMARGGEITWRTVSIVFDRLLFRIYMAIMTVMFISVFIVWYAQYQENMAQTVGNTNI